MKHYEDLQIVVNDFKDFLPAKGYGPQLIQALCVMILLNEFLVAPP